MHKYILCLKSKGPDSGATENSLRVSSGTLDDLTKQVFSRLGDSIITEMELYQSTSSKDVVKRLAALAKKEPAT